MPRHLYKKKKSLFGTFLEYGYHLWILLFVSNLLIFYSFSMFSFGAEKEGASPSPSISPEISPSLSPTTTSTRTKRAPTPKPNGPVIGLSFSVPGIGSAGGTFVPKRTKRNLTVYLYATDVNSNDNNVKPLYTVRTNVEFDTNPLSSTYTSFINPNIDLGDTVKNGKYQISFATDQALRKLVKDKDDAIGGKVVTVSRNTKAILPLQTVLMGDISPSTGNNIMDINDYNELVECFGQTQSSCRSFRQADLNDDGEVDGIDYNIMARSFKALVSEGIAPPQLPTPKPTQVKRLSELTGSPKLTKTPVPSPSSKPIVKKSPGNPIGAIFGFLFFLALLGGVGFFVATRTAFGKDLLSKILKKKNVTEPKDEPATDNKNSTTAEESPTETPPTAPTAETTTTESIAESTEIPIAQAEAEKKAAPSEAQPAPAAPATDPNAIDKTYYVKNKSKDDKGTWVTLTDDAGPIDGLLQNGTIEDGFERIKGTLVNEKGKKYILISEILPAE